MDLGECRIQSKKVVTPPDARVTSPLGIWFSGFKRDGSAEMQHHKTLLPSFHSICANISIFVIKNQV